MSFEEIKNSLPDYAKDIKLNLSSLISDESLDAQKKFGALLACALAAGNGELIRAAASEAGERLSPDAVRAAKTAAALMAMNNVYYRFTHLVSNPEYRTLPAKLRMNAIANPGVDKIDFELWSLAVSAINGCGACMESHEKIARKSGLSAEQVQTAVRIAAVTRAAAAVLDGEQAMT
ncbi:MAG: alkyl hydroperoxide reductase [Parvularculaceae bacterium]